MPLIHLLFDLTANGGWNLIAICVWLAIVASVAGLIKEGTKL